MRIDKSRIVIGSRVELMEDVEMINCIYTKGHQFTVYGESERGFDLVDDEGYKMGETLFIHDKLKLILPPLNQQKQNL